MLKKSDWLLLAFIVFTLIAGISLYSSLPEQVPSHWNIKGEVDDYSNKFFAIFFFPGINFVLFVLLIVLPKIDPRKRNYEQFKGVYNIFRWIIHLFLGIIYLLTLIYAVWDSAAIPTFMQVSFIVPFLVSLLFIIIGNYLGKIKDNFFVGVRTPWTLSSKEVWLKTHRLTGKLFVLSGVIGMIGSFFGGTAGFIMLFIPIIATSLFSILYSYFAFQQEQKKQ